MTHVTPTSGQSKVPQNGANPQTAPALPSWLYWVLLTTGVLTGVLLVSWVRGQAAPSSEPLSAPEKTTQKRPSLEERIRKHEEEAQRLCREALDRQMQAIPRFFGDAKQGCPEFADYALGWGSTRRWLQDLLPFGDCEKHKRFLEEKFAECIFAPESLEKVVEQTIKAYLKEVEQIENNMLLKLQEDVADFPTPFAKWDREQLQKKYTESLIAACQQAKKKLLYHDSTKLAAVAGDLVATRIISPPKITEAIATQILTRLGLRLSTSAAGMASGAVTFGIGLIVGAAIDWIIESILDRKGELAKQVEANLDELEKEISQAVRAELQQFAKERKAVRQAALQSLLTPTPQRDQE
ncbi:hypothetical protein [Thermogemmata fonticola]|uniref:Uncharacterized protein n=1 Tax=Thermogemmata fonticola TaxID=2755323 RepID=A0A7V8VC55_9BACT|nr:hypothetical protein [Thermogemmata fonticola]MBA2225319.1 hypothetical protein [Thermogemmata fonticola]